MPYIKPTEKVTLHECGKICANEPDCEGFIYDHESDECSPKQGICRGTPAEVPANRFIVYYKGNC